MIHVYVYDSVIRGDVDRRDSRNEFKTVLHKVRYRLDKRPDCFCYQTHGRFEKAFSVRMNGPGFYVAWSFMVLQVKAKSEIMKSLLLYKQSRVKAEYNCPETSLLKQSAYLRQHFLNSSTKSFCFMEWKWSENLLGSRFINFLGVLWLERLHRMHCQ